MGVWTPQGTIIAPSLPSDVGNLWEPSVIREGNPQILTSLTTVWKMWFCSGWGIPGAGTVNYAESPTALPGTWERRTIPVLTGYYRTFVRRKGDTLELFGATLDASRIDKLTSIDGIDWTFAETVVSASGASDELFVHNSAVYDEGDTTFVFYDQQSVGGYTTGLATSTNSEPYERQGTVMSHAGGLGTVGGPSPIHKINGTYYAWMIGSPGVGNLPSDVYRYSAPALIGPWMRMVTPALARTTADEGVSTLVGQLADPWIMEDEGKCYAFCCASSDGGQPTGASRLKLFIADMTREELVLTSEGVEGPIFPPAPVYTPVTYLNSWVSYMATTPAGYYRDNEGYINLQGLVKNGSAPNICILPEGARSSRLRVFDSVNGTQININADGSVALVGGSKIAVSLDGIRYPAA